MNEAQTTAVLNDLLDAESSSLLTRLAESAPFLSWASADDAPALRRIVADQTENLRKLTEMIAALGGVPRPLARGMDCAAAHYLDLEYLLPKLIDENRRLVEAYRDAVERIGAAPAGGLVADVLAAHEANLKTLEAMARNVA